MYASVVKVPDLSVCTSIIYREKQAYKKINYNSIMYLNNYIIYKLLIGNLNQLDFTPK